MEKDNKKPILNFEPGSRQPFILYLISITIISAIIVIVCLFTSGISFSEPKNDLLGDVNLDGKVDSADVLVLSQYFTGKTKISEEQMKAADVDNNGEVNSKDTMLIIQHISVQSSFDQEAIEQLAEEQTSEQASEQTSENDTTEQSAPSEESTDLQPTQSDSLINSNFVNSGKSDNSAFLTSESGVYYIARISNSWQAANGKYMYQIDFTVKNNSDKTVYNTSAKINLSDEVLVEKNWDCSANNDAGVIKITTRNEGRILSGGTFDCGIIISASSPITINSITK
ncbi:MAG: dockerin type I repeat-containing protein [Clostridia bacterium]|nr:dockerin type I repeat-containing protein [Clostridia bacterium]